MNTLDKEGWLEEPKVSLEDVLNTNLADTRDPMEILQEAEVAIAKQSVGRSQGGRSMTSRKPHSMNLGEISIGNLRVKKSGVPDSDGEIKVLATIPVDNASDKMLYVILCFQGLDEQGFVLEDLQLEGLVPTMAKRHALAGITWSNAIRYSKIKLWQLQKYYALEK